MPRHMIEGGELVRVPTDTAQHGLNRRQVGERNLTTSNAMYSLAKLKQNERAGPRRYRSQYHVPPAVRQPGPQHSQQSHPVKCRQIGRAHA